MSTPNVLVVDDENDIRALIDEIPVDFADRGTRDQMDSVLQ